MCFSLFINDLLLTLSKNKKNWKHKKKQYRKRKELWKRNYTFQNKALQRLLLKSMKEFEAKKHKRNIFDQKSHLHIEDFWLFTDPPVSFQKP